MIGMCLKKNNFEEQFPVCMYTYAGIFGIFWKKLEEIGRNFGGFYSGIVSIFLFMRKMSNELVVRIVELKKV